MSQHHNDSEFDAEIQRLQEHRPTLTALELDEIKTRVRGRKRSSAGPAWRAVLRTRAALTTAIAAGALMSTGGVALAVSGTASSGTASAAQYGHPSGPVAAANAEKSGETVTPVEATEQAPTTSSAELPFTGFVAITLIVLGVGLAATGLVLRFAVTRPRGAPRH